MSNTYKCRAEFMLDIAKLLAHIEAARVEIVSRPEMPDFVVTIETPSMDGVELEVGDLRSLIATIEDTQMMEATLAPLAKFSGEWTPMVRRRQK